MRTIRRRALSAATIAATAAILLSACSTGDATSTSSSSQAAQKTLVAAADPSLLPYNFLGSDNTTWKGINIDLAAALSKELGEKIVFQKVGFDSIVPGLTSGRYDLALTGMFDTKEREKSVDFVDYLKAQNNFLTRTGYRDISSMDDLCGESVGIPSGAIEGQLLETASKKCTAAGKKAISVHEYSTLNAVVTALTSKRIDVTPNDSAANAYIIKQAGGKGLKTSGGYEDEGYFAAAFPKGSKLTDRFDKAMTKIMADGTYASILKTWGIGSRAVSAPTINGSPF